VAVPDPAETVACVPPDPRAGRNAHWYLAGLAGSLVGNSAMSLVAGIWVKQLTGSSARAGLVSACVYLPTLLAPVAGLLADRFPRRAWLFTVNLISAATLLPLLAVRSAATTWIVFVAMFAYGVEATLIDPAEDALLAELFSVELRRRMNGRRLAIQEAGRFLAPLLGAGLFVLAGGGAVAALDAATFVLAAGVLTRLRMPAGLDAGPAPVERTPGRAIAAGLRHVWRTPAIRPVAGAAAAVMALSGVGVAAQYSLVSGLGQRPAFLGVLSAILGAGSILAALTAGRLIERVGERALAVIGLLDFAAGNLLRATGWLPAALLGTLGLGFALPYVFLAVLAVAQRATPTRLQGRVSGALTLVLFGSQAPTQTLGALLVTRTGYAEIYTGSAGLGVALALALALGNGRELGLGWPRPRGTRRRR
jgi:MFS family permease